MYRIAIEDIRTQQIGLVSKDDKIQEFEDVNEAKRKRQEIDLLLPSNKESYIFTTYNENTKTNTWNKLNTDELTKKLVKLRKRYLAERGHEKEKDYMQYAQKHISNRVIKMTKRPFGFVIKCLDGYLQIGIKREGKYLTTFAKNYEGKLK